MIYAEVGNACELENLDIALSEAKKPHLKNYQDALKRHATK